MNDQPRTTRLGRLFAAHPGLGILVIGIGTLSVPFDSAVNVAFPDIIRAFGLPITSIQWVVISYTLTYAALMLVFGRVGDMAGYRRIFQIGTGWSVVAFLLCAAAPSFGWLLAARVLQGIGAAMTLSCGPALATSLYPEAERTRILALYTMLFSAGGAAGPILAGQLVQYFGWPAVFWFRVPLSLIALLLATGLPAGTPQSRQRFDAPGAVLLVLTITTMLLALNQLQHLDTAAWRLALLAGLTVAAAIGFVMREQRTAQPIMALHFFRDGDFTVVNLANVGLNLAGFSIMLLMPFYLDRAAGLSVGTAGVVLAASPLGIMLAAPLAGRLAVRISPRRLALIGAAMMAAAQTLIGEVSGQLGITLLTCFMALQGIGLGLFQVAYFDITTASMPRSDRGVAGSLVMMTRTIGVVTAATVLMLIFQTLRMTALAHGVSDAAAFLSGFQGAFRIAAAISVIVVAAFFVRGWAKAPAPR